MSPEEVGLWPHFSVPITGGKQDFRLHLLQFYVASGGGTMSILRILLL